MPHCLPRILGRQLAAIVLGFWTISFAAPSPKLPERFSADFQEVMYMFNESAPNGIGTLLGNATGSWKYDFSNSRWMYEHGGGGMFSMFCAANDPARQRCKLYFVGHESMRVQYANGTCCSLCAAAEGCSMLRPDYLTHGNFAPSLQPSIVVRGEKCIGWGRAGAVTTGDSWFETEDGTPCQYYEGFKTPRGLLMHNVTFLRETYSTAPISDDVFTLPSECSKLCPRHGYPPKDEHLNLAISARSFEFSPAATAFAESVRVVQV